MVVAREFCVVVMRIIAGPVKGAHRSWNITLLVRGISNPYYYYDIIHCEVKIRYMLPNFKASEVLKTPQPLIWAIVIQQTQLIIKVWRNIMKSSLCWIIVTVCITDGLANRSLHGVTRLLLTNSATMEISLNKLYFQQVKNKREWTETEGLFDCGFGEPPKSAGKHY